MELLTVIKCPATRGAAATAMYNPTHQLSVNVRMRVYARGICPQSVRIFSNVAVQCYF